MLYNPRPRILCVDHDNDCRAMLAVLLGFAHMEAQTVATAAAALHWIRAAHFDLYVTEAWLPQVDGFQLCRQIRSLEPHVPILFFSGAAFKADTKKGIDAGANDYVIKPDLDGLLERINYFLPFAQSAARHGMPSEAGRQAMAMAAGQLA